MPDPQLTAYIQGRRGDGANEIQIYGELRKSGWNDAQIAQAMGSPRSHIPAPASIAAEAYRSALRDDAATRAVTRDFIVYGLIGTAIGIIGGYLSGAILASEFSYAFRQSPEAADRFSTDLHLGSDLLTLTVAALAYGILGFAFSRHSQTLIDAIARQTHGRIKSLFWVLFLPGSTLSIIISLSGALLFMIAAPILAIPFLVDAAFRVAGHFIIALGASRSMKRNLGVEGWVVRA